MKQISVKDDYVFWKHYEWNEGEFANVYIHEYSDKVALDVIEVIRIPELQKTHIKMLQEHYKIMLEEYFGELGIDTDLTYIYILCVDKITPAFRELIDQIIVERDYKFFFPVGICFTEKEAYMPFKRREVDAGKYLHFRSNVLDILYKEM